MAESAQPNKPIRVAIVGGGCAGISAAWQLARQPGYDIHIFEKSWRLGGKGASVRASDGRILEHGLHLWLGCYENAFRMMRDCYEEVEKRGWGPDAKERLAHARFDDAFLPEPHVGVAIPGPDGGTVWSGFFPPEKGLPGDPLDADTNPFTLANYLLRCLSLLKTLMQSVISAPEDDVPGMPRSEHRSNLDEAVNLAFSIDTAEATTLLIERMTQLLRGGALTGFAALLQAVTILENWLQETKQISQSIDTTIDLMEAVAAQMRKLLRDVVAVDDKIRTRTEIIDIVLTIAVGLFRDRVLFDDRGLDAINEIDYREWLSGHGATKSAVNSRFLTGIYDFVFAYREGSQKTPELAAGVALRGALRMFFTYRGSMFWRVRSGMGDTVFAPLYKVLTAPDRMVTGDDGKEQPASTVRFHFLHDLEKVGFEVDSSGRRYVSSLLFRTSGAGASRDKLQENALDQCGSWPASAGESAKAGESAEAGESAKEEAGSLEWRLGQDFDGVILAMGIDDFKKACDDGIKDKDRGLPRHWVRMCDEVKTVATQSAQLWLKKDTRQLGWYRGNGVITALGASFDTWADMTHTLPSEQAWRLCHDIKKKSPLDSARSVAYFCGPLAEAEVAQFENEDAARKKVEEDLEKLLQGGMKPFWPEGFRNGKNPNPKRFEVARHVEANFSGSDRYTLSLPGSVRYRISPLDRSVENMTIAGDWTACGFDAGCVESAVMSGMLAAYAISGKPDPKTIVGYDHP